jgi:hypothetical protein
MASRELAEEIAYFKETFRLLNSDGAKFKYRLQKHPFPPSQKKLLQAFQHFKKNQREEIFALLKGYKLEQPFFEGFRLYLLGLAHNHFGAYAFAAENLEKSLEVFRGIGEEEFFIEPLTVLIIVLGNQRKLQAMEKYIDEMNDYTPANDHMRLIMIHAELYYLVLADKLTKASNLLKKTLSSSLANLELFRPSFLISYFGIAFKQKDYALCFKILEDYKLTNGFTVKSNFLYMRCLLDHIVHEKPLYFYASNFKDFPELLHQLEVIASLAKGEVERASRFWSLLSKHNPALYGDDFHYAGDYSLFSCALAKHRPSGTRLVLKYEDFLFCKSNLEKLHRIFSLIDSPLPKADLVKLIWNEEDSLEGQARLRLLIHRYKQKYGVDIVSYQASYQRKKLA